jgi:hypothetical protein
MKWHAGHEPARRAPEKTPYPSNIKVLSEKLRDHMTDLELIFSMLGEAATKEIAVNRDRCLSF